MKIIGDQNVSLKPWLQDNQNRLLKIFNDYQDCKDIEFSFLIPYVSFIRMQNEIGTKF